ncbi:BgTH12-03004 [Blumeria graminis f. sp. triticale]|uniref:BgTH12-03004 n=1 Tax=Blumeria graminis f. sp. triticale TaxID=1689686 RepID=A0A9W4D3S3_BLUGR|nr:BgTH12-03004 [Blumeria graminis f. sp. triticale]
MSSSESLLPSFAAKFHCHLEAVGILVRCILNYELLSDSALPTAGEPPTTCNLISSSSSFKRGTFRRCGQEHKIGAWLFCYSSVEPLLSGTARVPPLPRFVLRYPIIEENMVHSDPLLLSETEFLSDRHPESVFRANKQETGSPSQQFDFSDKERDVLLPTRSNTPGLPCSCRMNIPLSRKYSPVSLNSTITPESKEKNDDVDPVSNITEKNSIPFSFLFNTSSSISNPDFYKDHSHPALIPTHSSWRNFIYTHEIPRKLLHVSIGVFSIHFFLSGIQTTAITPWLTGALFLISATDYLRHNNETFNQFYIRILGVLMRESEHRGWNGVVWYLLGAWFVLVTFPKDVSLMSILLLSWCDTAASTIGRAYGKYTIKIRKGKSVAGSAAAFIVGVATAVLFWGWLAPRSGPFPHDCDFPFMFTGSIRLPSIIREWFGLSEIKGSVGGASALCILSIWTGFVASTSEFINLFGLDDNLTIPLLSGVGIWSFLKVFR